MEDCAGKTETEAPESTRKCSELPVEPAGRGKVSSCWAVTFPTRNRELYISEPCHHNFDDTSRGQVNLNGVRRKEEQMDSKGKDQGLENAGNGHGKREELELQERDNHLGQNERG